MCIALGGYCVKAQPAKGTDNRARSLSQTVLHSPLSTPPFPCVPCCCSVTIEGKIAAGCYEHRPLGKRFKRHVTVGITPDRFKRVTSHLTSDRNTLTNTRYSGT